jgi:hypothetical protein
MDNTKALYKVATREEAVEKYREWFHKERVNNMHMYAQLSMIFHSMILERKDVNLVCYCAPKSCHGEIIKEYLESL